MRKSVTWFLFSSSTAASALLWSVDTPDGAGVAASIAGGVAIATLETIASTGTIKAPRPISVLLAACILAACAVFNHFLTEPYMQILNITAGIISAAAVSQLATRFTDG